MTELSEEQALRFRKAQRQFLLGVGLVMFGMIFGGGLAMVFYFLNLRLHGVIAGLCGAAFVLGGMFIQAAGAQAVRDSKR